MSVLLWFIYPRMRKTKTEASNWLFSDLLKWRFSIFPDTSVGIKSWPCLPLINSWLPPVITTAKFWKREHVEECMFGYFGRFPSKMLNFIKKKYLSSHQITPQVNHWYYRWWISDPSLIQCWSIVDAMLVHRWFNLYSRIGLRQHLKGLNLWL